MLAMATAGAGVPLPWHGRRPRCQPCEACDSLKRPLSNIVCSRRRHQLIPRKTSAPRAANGHRWPSVVRFRCESVAACAVRNAGSCSTTSRSLAGPSARQRTPEVRRMGCMTLEACERFAVVRASSGCGRLVHVVLRKAESAAHLPSLR
jgi:hypothetical protein